MMVELMHAWRVAHKHAAHHSFCALFSVSSCIDNLSAFNVAISPLLTGWCVDVLGFGQDSFGVLAYNINLACRPFSVIPF